MFETAVPLEPRKPNGKLSVVAIGRISTPGQDVENIEASYRYVQEYLGRIYNGPMEITLLGEQASGMLVDRPTIREAEDLVASGKVDLVISEDLARIYRNPRHQYRFVQDCVDVGTRVICVGDNLDTTDENWEVTMGAAALRHGLHIPDTRRRVRRTATHCFHNGGMVQKIRYGYRKLSEEEAASGRYSPTGLRIAKRAECTAVIRAMKDRVMRGDTYATVAEWLDAEGIEPGPHVESGRWAGRLVADLLDDPIVSGTRTFRDTIYHPIFKTGKHKATTNAEPETEYCPTLAHLSVEEHGALRREIARRRETHVSKNVRRDRRRNVPRSRSIWPGQAAACGVCEGPMYFMGRHLKCKNSLPGPSQSCWNHVQVPAELTRKRALDWLLNHLDHDPRGRKIFVEALWKILEPLHRRSFRRQADLQGEVESLQKKAANLAEAIAEGGELKTLVEQLRGVENALKKARRRQVAERASPAEQDPAQSRRRLESHLDDTLRSLISTSFEFADLLRRVFAEFVIQPVQALDSGLVRPRGKLTLCWNGLCAATQVDDAGAGRVEDVQITLDLFEPPLHIRHLRPCLAAREENPKLSLEGIAALLEINHMVVKRAFDYARLMEAQGTSEPYLELHARPENASRWRTRRQRSQPSVGRRCR